VLLFDFATFVTVAPSRPRFAFAIDLNRAGHALTYTTAKALSRCVKGILALVRSQMTDGSRPPRRHIELSAHFSGVTGLRLRAVAALK